MCGAISGPFPGGRWLIFPLLMGADSFLIYFLRFLARLDSNRDGVVSEKEYVEVMSASVVQRLVREFCALDVDDDGKVSPRNLQSPHNVLGERSCQIFLGSQPCTHPRPT